MIDPRFYVKVLSATFEPQRLIWLAMHQDYYEGAVADVDAPQENAAGELVVKHLLLGERGHYGPLEHPSISFAVSGFPHSVMQQARTHRVGISFDVQSMRYTGKRIAELAQGNIDVEDIFYFRGVGSYADRFGKKYAYTKKMRETDIEVAKRLAMVFDDLVGHVAKPRCRDRQLGKRAITGRFHNGPGNRLRGTVIAGL